MIIQSYLCLGTTGSGTETYYEGNDLHLRTYSDGVFKGLAYQLNFIGNPITAVFRMTLDHPAGLPKLLEILHTAQPQFIRFVVVGQDPDTGQPMPFVDYRGSAKLISVTPHLPNVKSPVNSAFSDMTDVEFHFTGLLEIEEISTGTAGSQTINLPPV